MISKFFIDRPIFAGVFSILIFAIGMACISILPIARFPEITPPTVQIRAVYPGANAETVAESVGTPIEQELSGVDNLIYFSSTSTNDGALAITATFEIGSDVDLAAVEIQNRLKRAEPRLPQEVVRQGITVNKASTALLLVASISSTDPKQDALFLSNYASINMIDTLRRVPGVGDATVFGSQQYAMRIWINPDKLASRGLTITDLSEAIREQNGLYAAGRIGSAPTDHEVELTIPVVTRGRLQTPEEFEQIIIRAQPDGSFIRLSDVARVELSAQSYDLQGRLDGKPTTFILTYLQPAGNALQTTKLLRQSLDTLSKSFPKGVTYDVPFDTTPFIQVAIEEVATTFTEAIILVSLVVLLFLGTWRASMIPLLAVPVAIIGTFTGMYLLGFSINSLTLFGLVLAIGIVVDDAIIVVENVERIMHEEHLAVRDATIRAMQQVSGPIIAIVLVLSSVFLPVGFMGGLTGELYRQFAVTIAISVMISGFVALSLSPAMCVVMLKKGTGKKLLPFRVFDTVFSKFTNGYAAVIRQTIRYGYITLIVFGVVLFATYKLFEMRPTGFIPSEDQGYLIVVFQLPQGASLDRTLKKIGEIEEFALQQKEIQHVVGLAGMDLLAGFSPSTNAGLMFVKLAPWDDRKKKENQVDAIVGRFMGHFAGDKDALILAINPPPVQGLGFRSGFELQLESRQGNDIRALNDATSAFTAALRADPQKRIDPTSIRATLNVGLPQLYIDIDRERAKLNGVSISDIYNTLQALLGSFYVNDFLKFGRIYRVQLMAEPAYRSSPESINQFFVRNRGGEMVPLSGLVSSKFQSGPNLVSHFNGYPAVTISGSPSAGFSTGQAIQAVTEIAGSRNNLPDGYTFEWSGSSFQEIKAGKQAPLVIGMGLFVVFLVLCALYERWTLPIAVLLGIPSGAFGAILAITIRGTEKDIYFQIGLLTLIGLAAKNAILIVEFAATLRQQGRTIREAAVEAARVRLRPFIMTSMAFILGVTPLVIASGAGASGRHSIGTGVMGGMLAATFLDMFFIPLFFFMVEWVGEKFSRKGHPATERINLAPPTLNEEMET
ncbi:efflux RND transporter permease subunit [soil metagenome]